MLNIKKGSAHLTAAVTNYNTHTHTKSGLKTAQIYLIALEVKILKLKC